MPEHRIEWTAEVARSIDTRSLRIYRKVAINRKREAEFVLGHVMPNEGFMDWIRLFLADVEAENAIISTIETELGDRGVTYE